MDPYLRFLDSDPRKLGSDSNLWASQEQNFPQGIFCLLFSEKVKYETVFSLNVEEPDLPSLKGSGSSKAELGSESARLLVGQKLSPGCLLLTFQ